MYQYISPLFSIKNTNCKGAVNMLNLIKKDITNYKKLIAVFLIITGINISSSLLTEPDIRSFWFAGIFGATLLIAFYPFFEFAKRNTVLWCSMPVKRSSIVLSFYVNSLIIMTAGIVLFVLYAFILDRLVGLKGKEFAFLIDWKYFYIYFFAVILFTSVFLPPVFKFGSVAGVWLSTFIVWFLLLLPYTLIKKSLYSQQITLNEAVSNLGIPGFFPLISVVLISIVYISVKLSVYFFNYRDL